jgi:TonB family protein
VVVNTPPPPNAIQAVTRAPPPQTNFTKSAPAPAAVPDSGPSTSPTIGSSRPEYPEQYADSGRAGVVTVTCTIQTDGSPTGCKISSVSGGSAFGSTVLNWLNSGRVHYRPAIRGGHPVEGTANLRVSFQSPD